MAFSWSPDPELIKAFEEAGADEVRIALETLTEQDALAKLEEIACKVLDEYAVEVQSE